jgi:hypothetical protein
LYRRYQIARYRAARSGPQAHDLIQRQVGASFFLPVVAYLPITCAVMLSFFKKTAFNPAMS